MKDLRKAKICHCTSESFP